MKNKSSLLTWFAALAAFTFPVVAGPLQEKDLSAGARWVVHLDVERLLATDIGKFIGAEILDRQLAKPLAHLRQELNLDFDWRQLRSLTAYGMDLQKKPEAGAVLILRSAQDIEETVENLAQRFEALGARDANSFRRVTNTDDELYAIGSKGFAATLPGNTLVLSQSRERVEAAVAVLKGTGPGLPAERRLTGLNRARQEILVAGLTESPAQVAKLPPPAAALRNVSGGLFTVGEEGDQLAATLALRASSTEAAAQLQQIAEGLAAFAALTKPEDKNLMELVRSIKVSSSGEQVTLNARYPAARVQEELVKRAGKKKGKQAE
jgi:hypothetical protein